MSICSILQVCNKEGVRIYDWFMYALANANLNYVLTHILVRFLKHTSWEEEELSSLIISVVWYVPISDDIELLQIFCRDFQDFQKFPMANLVTILSVSNFDNTKIWQMNVFFNETAKFIVHDIALITFLSKQNPRGQTCMINFIS